MRIVLAALMVGGTSASAAASATTSLRTSALPVEGMRDARELSEDFAWDDDFFSFNDNTLWTDYAINPKRCVEFNGQEVIVFSMYGGGHNNCARAQLGTYYAPVGDFVKGYTKQKDMDYNLQGNDYDVPDEVAYTTCTAAYGDDDGGSAVYLKLGCNDSTGKAIAMKAYEDSSCTEPKSNNYNIKNLGIDISDLRVKFETCQDCVYWPAGDDDAWKADVDDGFEAGHGYDSPMCGAAWKSKTKCNRKCQRLANKGASTYSYNAGFNAIGKFFLFVFTLSGIFLLLAVHSQRKRMATEDAVYEEALVQKVGMQMKHVVFGIMAIIVFTILFALLKAKFLTWFFLLGSNVILFGYWAYLRFRKEGKVEVGGFRLFGDNDGGIAA
eukprot:CAMPEP_0185812426 /NCGR_PEP_ID=MMETSP1322-20130828/9334_1 /TAXON_ID=265543 /ORGANISM="Minutocellus polymorphus, Strain RCC2270" /LENGTH=381 /DNA_ID=CAMNT_0028508961 /DNA_START=110 /DNA_END=1255 /DNA_ORIENTATION=+